ncbi:MAG: hypothetical protein II304_03475 [Bacteroidales bacterium]|nr:hypothetical protein [Bacteroidales bacterium]
MAEEKSTTSLNKARVEELLGFIKQTFYSQAEHEQGIKDFNAWWLSVLGQPNGVPKTDANNKILQGFFPDYILGQLLWGGTIAGNDKISPSSHLSSKIDIVDESISVGNVAKYTGIYFIATADANTSGSIVNSLDVRTGDWVISTGVEWVKIDNTDAVRSVADYVGSITAEDLRNRLVGQYKDRETYKNYALGTMHYADGSGKASQLTTTEFARSILGGIASQSVFSGLYADKAKTLLNKRKLWGQEFDGSQSVYGDMFLNYNTNNTNSSSGKLWFCGVAPNIRDVTGPYIQAVYTPGYDHGRKRLSIFQHNAENYTTEPVEVFTIYPNGNVGIGTNSPEYKLHVNGTFNAQGATTLNSTLLVKDLATFEKNILLANANTIGFKHTDGQSNINLLSLTENNEARFGYGTIAKGLTSTIYGKEIQFKTKDSLNNDAVIDDNGNFHSYHDISAAGGVSASGVNDFGIGGGSVGTGGKTYKLTKIDGVTNTILELSATDGSQTETVALNQFGSSFAGLVPATNGAPKTSVLSTEGWRILTANDIPSLDWSKIATGKPTTIGGYGITDAFTKSQIENGVFPNMRVGLADDLGDIEETLDEEYTFQPTANPNEIRDGYAQIESLKGNSLVWNQLMKSNNLSLVKPNSYFEILVYKTAKKNHTYYATLEDIDGVGETLFFVGADTSDSYTEIRVPYSKNPVSAIFTISPYQGYLYMRVAAKSSASSRATFNNVRFHDLTQMFGEGNEPETVEEFERRCPKGMSMDYNEGEIINLTADAIKSVGFNQWDEEWELGALNFGNKEESEGSIISKNYIRVLAGVQYNLNKSNAVLMCYDENYNFIEYTGQTGSPVWKGGIDIMAGNSSKSIFTFPQGTAYTKFYISSIYGATYNHDICINLSDPDKNGTYEPYTEFMRDLPTELFEGGMKSAGTAHDEIYFDKAKGKYIKVTRIGSVDLGTLNWENRGAESKVGVFSTSIANRNVTPYFNALCALYNNKGVVSSANIMASATNKSLYGYYKNEYYGNTIYIYDSAYTDAESFKQAMSGVILYYELAEPIVEEIDIPYMDYQVSNSGTEEIVSGVPTTPVKARVTYNFDTVGTVKQNRFDISNLKTSISNLSKGIGVSGNWVLDGLKIGTYDVLHKGNTSLAIDSGDNFGFTLKVADTEIQMSDITEDELREMINTAWGTNYEA